MDERTRSLIRAAVEETLVRIGIDIDDPKEAQADFAYLRRLRMGATRVRTTIINSALIIVVCSVLYALGQNISAIATTFFNNLHR